MDFRKEIDLLESEKDKAILNMAYSQILRYQETQSEDDLDFFCDIVEGIGMQVSDKAMPIMYRMVEFYLNS